MYKKSMFTMIAGSIIALGLASVQNTAQAESRKDQAKQTQFHLIGDRHSGDRHYKKGHRRHGMRHRIRRFMERYDTNGDGKILQEEIDTERTNNLSKFDSDKDGKLSLSEFQKLWMAHQRRKMVRSFQRFDTDGDAAVTLDEYKHPLEKFVQRHDRNGDGAVSREDRRKKHRGYRHNRKKRMESDKEL